MPRPTSAPRRIAILGGGVGAISAAFELTSEKDWHERYRITIYQQGWRLGGKGASGRNAAMHDRIEEHGLHMWWGFYENAFSMMKRCYAEVDEFHATLRDQFIPQDSIGFVESFDGVHHQKSLVFPRNARPIGELSALDEQARYLRGLAPWLRHLAERVDDRVLLRVLSGGASQFVRLGLHRRLLRELANLLDGGEDGAALRRDVDDVVRRLVGADPDLQSRLGRRAILELAQWLRDSLRPPKHVRGRADYECRWYFIWADFLLTSFCGLLRDDVFGGPNGFDDLDEIELSAWLLRHGIHRDVTLPSVLMRGLYDAAFCFAGGDATRPNVSAGVVLRTFLRMFLTYDGSYMWRMAGGMGDVIFAPLYLALMKRARVADELAGTSGSLRFEFFHRVEKLRLSPDGHRVAAIEVARQATVLRGAYAPLCPAGPQRVPAWPSEPLYDQLREGERLRALARAYPDAHPLESTFASWEPAERRRLEVGRDFDVVLLGIPVAALGDICSELVARSTRWAEMVSELKTIRTQAAQIWLHKTCHELGWHAPDLAVIAGHADPLNSLADMSHVLGHESWPGDPPRSVVYFCGPMCEDHEEPRGPAPGYPATQVARVRAELAESLRRHAVGLWPRAAAAGTGALDWDVLVAPSHLKGERRLEAQYCRANIDPSERYVLAAPGTAKYRIAPGESGFDNLVLAGDWTHNELKFGCVEAATQSGLAAARAIRSGAFGRTEHAEVPTLPVYRQPFSEQVFQPPYRLAGAVFQAHLLAAPSAILQRACDRHLNGVSSRWTFRPLGGFILLTLGYVGSNRSVFGPEATFGDGPELSLGFVIPVVKEGVDGSELGLFPLCAIVDNSLSLATGREVLGFSKQIGWFDGDLEQVGGAVSVETMVFERFGLGSRLTRRPIARFSAARKPSDPLTAMRKLWSRGMPGVKALAVAEWTQALRTRRLAVFNLLQIRDLRQPERARLQKVTKSYLEVERVHDFGRLGPSQVELLAFDSHPLARDVLGLPHVDQVLEPFASLWMRYDATQGAINEEGPN